MMKTIFSVIGGLLGLLILGVAGFFVYFLVILPRDLPVPDLTVEVTPERVERGSYLANTMLGCMYCHSERDWDIFGGPIKPGTLGKGGEVFDESVGVSGFLVSQNITPYNLSSWTDGELYRLIVSGLHKDDFAVFPIMPSDAYRYLETEDVYAIIAYLRTLEPIEADHPPHELTTLMTIIANSRAIPPEPWDIDWDDPVSVGEYYARIGGCTFCHTTVDERMQPVEGMRLAGVWVFRGRIRLFARPIFPPIKKPALATGPRKISFSDFTSFVESACQRRKWVSIPSMRGPSMRK